MDNFRDSYFKVNWDLTTNPLKGTYWGKQYDTGRGFVVTVINGDQVVTATNEVLRLKWEKPDNTTGYVNATIVNGKFIIENIDQMFTVQGSVRADFELSVGGKFVASTTFYVSVAKAVAVDSIESSSEFTALHSALLDVGTVQDSLDGYVDAESVRVANESIRIDNESDREAAEGLRVSAETDREAAEALRQTGYATMDEAIALKADLSEIEAARGTEPTLEARLDSTDAQLNNMTQNFTQHKLDYVEEINIINTQLAEKVQKDKELSENHIIRTLSNGIKDEISLIENKIIKRVSDPLIINGSENWGKVKSGTTEGVTPFYLTFPNVSSVNYIESDKFATLPSGYLNYDGGDEGIGFYGPQLRIKIDLAKLVTPNADGFKLWLQENNVVANYSLTTPVNVPLPILMTPNTIEIARLSELTNKLTNAIISLGGTIV